MQAGRGVLRAGVYVSEFVDLDGVGACVDLGACRP